MKLKIKSLCSGIVIAMLFYSFNAKSQNKVKPDYSSYPYWIKMMDDTTANYFDAVLAFNTYWKDKQKPMEENERFEEAGMPDTVAKKQRIPYGFEYMKFKNWQMQIEPYVQDNGSILYPYQRLSILQDERRSTPINSGK